MNEREFTINNKTYQLNKIDPFKQFHVVRKLAPILADLLPVAAKLKNFKDGEMGEDQLAALAPLANSFAKLPDADANYILVSLLGAVAVRQEAGNYAMLARGEQIMFQDMDLPLMLQCAGRAFMYNLGGFFAGHLSLSQSK